MSNLLVSLSFLLFALPISIYDIAEYRIPDPLSLGGLAFIILLRTALHMEPLPVLLLNGAIGFAVFWLIHVCTRGRLGLGDAKYSALIAAAFGVSAWLVALLFASIAGLVFAGIAILAFKMKRTARIPFAPFLTLGAACAMAFQGVLKGILSEGEMM